MQPDLELVHIRKGESFAAWKHGYPFRTVRWHYHPEYEIHQVVATSGKFYIGDHVGEFAPGQLIMTGPNLPQNWISDIRPGEIVPQRTQVIQFPESFIDGALATFPELDAARHLLDRSRRGVLFGDDTAQAVRPLIRRLIDARGTRRLGLFFEILDLMVNAPQAQTLASLSFVLDLEKAEESDMNRAIAHLRDNLNEPLSEAELAELTGQSQSAFSRSFKRHTGTTLVRYRNQLRIDLACHMLLSDPDTKVADICFEVGFSNLSNFNRHFLKLKNMSPSEFRATFAANNTVRMAS
ncbi:AraC family transcriptional regulator [Paracoccus sp. R12_1]|jgi:AraC-like DNA-binding protein|uniref:AraC family transcriptional regulator n=1 Tax=Paracoccus maritimus TaxID=2933292 RepID=A0ABT2KAB7_9RHOB|nr:MULTISPECIES: AraC family transcriptional regulator [unclassified Paracoccus (in: a-proteobacteria)]MBO9455014.1 AraC family transcriptional regulator [Paracoccus sp. R12_2]MBO9485298.1 AraC family transcriptional regulator [Paracoccus sp. R12_1]MCT4333472.1 AraC family transcriptional regulator [Paracoccus sp. YLB-12]PHQ68735.1 MAG: AraC family transcriptional regulator [Paracoccus sp. (in: a-proteobacteria)]